MSETLFLKLGGSLITDKTGVEKLRPHVLTRLAAEIAAVKAENPELRLLLGHGSGSYGHVAAKKYGTRQGVAGKVGWFGFVEAAAAAARLNRLVVEALLVAGMPAFSVQPSALATCDDGKIISFDNTSIKQGLQAGLLPVVYGDIAFDTVRGGTIISTEAILSFLTGELQPSHLLLAGEVAGVLAANGELIPEITPASFAGISHHLGGSRGTDVTGGMMDKVREMVNLCRQLPQLKVFIFSGLIDGLVGEMLLGGENAGTRIGN